MTDARPVLRNFVGGAYAEPKEGRTAPVVDPATGEAYAPAPVSTAADVDAAMGAAAAAFEVWRDATPSQRQRGLLRMADAVEAHADEIVAAECRNTGKPVALTRQEELGPLVDELRFFAGAARLLEGKSAGEYLREHTSWIRREPIGVCAQVAPWNYPMVMAVWKFAPAIAAGNTVVLKPSDTTPVTTLMLAEIAAECLPPGRAQRGLRRPRHRSRPDRAPHPAARLDHRLHPGRYGGGRGGRAGPQAGAPGAGWQGAGHRVRRRRR